MKKFLICILFLLFQSTFAQRTQITFVDFLHECLTTKESIDLSNYGDYPDALFELGSITGYELSNANLILGDLTEEDLDFEEEGQLLNYSMDHPVIRSLKKKYPNDPIEIDEDGRLIIRNNILLVEISFEYFDLGNLNIKGMLALVDFSQIQDKAYSAYIQNCSIDYLFLYNYPEFSAHKPDIFLELNTIGNLYLGGPVGLLIIIEDNKINKLNTRSVHAENIGIHNNIFYGIEEQLTRIDSNYLDNFDQNQHIVQMRDSRTDMFHFGNNEVHGTSESLLTFQAASGELSFHDNEISGSLLVNSSKASDRFLFTNNRISGVVGFHEFIFSETYNEVDWNNLNGKMVSLSTVAAQDRYIEGFQYDFSAMQTRKQLQDTTASDHLIRTYYNLYSIYKQNGNLRYANSSYSQMKDLETNRLKYFYEESGDMKSWFRWKLGQLLKFYTDNGTDPARSLQVSAYLILIFAVFYMFYPSDWDSNSKKELVRNIKAIFDKNIKTTRMSVLGVFSALLMTILNAVTLSINSFVTLGFGKIPTYGLARYVCIVQGFLGWFLLSLFTVALINQVLF